MPLGPCKHPPLPNKPGSTNWVEKTGGLPHFIDCVARAIYHTGRSHGDVSTAVKFAIGKTEDWASGKGNVTSSTRAQAAAAVAQLKAQGAASKAQTRAKNLSDCGCGNLDLSQRIGEVVDLAAFDETEHHRLPKGGAEGGRFTSVVTAISKLKQGETHTVHGPSGTKVKRITATRFLVESSGKSRTTDNPHAAAKQAVEMAQASAPVKRKSRPGMTLSSDLERRVVDLTERLTA